MKQSKTITAIKQSLSIVLSISLVLPNLAMADIIVDGLAPKPHQPTVLKTPNGVVQVDITKPSSGGVSMNEYSEFNTPKTGIILNNSRNGADSRIGGYIQANFRLSDGAARLIVNKVNSSSPSHLQGNIEIAGDKADLMIANPSGISIDGVHVINSKSTTFTTGEIKYNRGDVESIDVKKSSISIVGGGLKDESAYINILAKSAKINANIHANELNIVTGLNVLFKDGDIKRADTNSRSSKKEPSSTEFFIDSSNLGGMYANKIKLVGTKDGVGINNAGKIASSSSIEISSNGDLINSGDIVSNGHIAIKTKNISNNKATIASNTIDVKTDKLSGKDSTISSNEELNIKAKNLTNKNSTLANQKPSSNSDKSKSGSPSSALLASKIVANDITNDNTNIASNSINLDISKKLSNINSTLDLKSINNQIENITNDNSNLNIASNTEIKINSLKNNNSKIHSNGAINLVSNSIVNTNSHITSSKNIAIKATSLDNISSTIASNSQLSIDTKDTFKNISSQIYSADNISIKSNLLDNTNGLMLSSKNLFIDTDSFINHGELKAKDNLSVSTRDDMEHKGGFYASKDIFITTTKKFLNSKELIANNNLHIKAGFIANTQNLFANSDLSLNAQSIKNISHIAANGKLNIDTTRLDNISATIHAKDIAISADTISNDKAAQIVSFGDMFLNTKILNNADSSKIISLNNLSLFYDKDLDSLGASKVTSSAALLKSDRLDNLSSFIYSNGDISINTKELNNKSLDELKKYKQTNSATIDIKCHQPNCPNQYIKINLDINSLKDEIIAEYKINNNKKDPTPEYIDKKLKEEIIKKDERLFILNLHKGDVIDSGSNTKIYNTLTIDYLNGVAILSKSRPKDREKSRKIEYSITKELIDAGDLAKFRLSQIIAKKSIEFLVTHLLNDKSTIYAHEDITLKDTNLKNIGLELKNRISSIAYYGWQVKKKKRWWKRSKWVDEGGYLPRKIINYTEIGYLAIFAARGVIKGNIANLSNSKPQDIIISNNKPKFNQAYSNTFFNSVNDKKYGNLLNLNHNLAVPAFYSSAIAPIDDKYRYYNTSYIYNPNIANSDYMHNKIALIYNNSINSLNSLLSKNIDTSGLNSGSLIYSGGGIKLDIDGNLQNYADIISAGFIDIKANSILNHQAQMKSAEILKLTSNRDISNISSNLQAASVYIDATNSIYNQTLSSKEHLKESSGYSNFTNVSKTSTISSTSKDIYLNANKDIFISGGDMHSANSIFLNAKNSIVTDTIQDKQDYHFSSSGGYYMGSSTKHIGSNLSANNNIILNSNRDISLKSATISSLGDTLLKAGGKIELLSSIDSLYSQSEFSKKGFMRKSTEFSRALDEDVVFTAINSKNIYLNSNQDILLQSANLAAKDSIALLSNKASINITPTSHTSTREHQVTSYKFGGLKKSMNFDVKLNTHLKGSSLTTSSGDIRLNADKDINIIASKLSSANNIILSSNDKISILSQDEIYGSKSISKKSSFNPLNLALSLGSLGLIDKPFYEASLHKQLDTTNSSKSSFLSAANSIAITSTNDITVQGSDISAFKNIYLNSKEGGIDILASKDKRSLATLDKEIKVSMVSPLNSIKQDFKKLASKNQLKNPDTKVKVAIAKASYDEIDKNRASLTSKASNIKAGKDIIINSLDDIFILGSNIEAKESVLLNSDTGNINISSDTSSIDEKIKEKHLKAALNLTAQNEYVEIGSAAKALLESLKQLKNAKKEYSNYKKELSSLKDKHQELKQRYKNKEAGIDYSDLKNIASLIDLVSSKDRHYKRVIALATTDVATKTAALASQGATAASSSATYGFSVGVSADTSGEKSTQTSSSTTSSPSNIKSDKVYISTDKELDTSVNITGSNILADTLISIDTKDLNVNASSDTFNRSKDTKALSGSISYSIYGGGGGTAGLNYSNSNLDITSIKHNNSNLLSDKDIYINTSGSANLSGITLHAKDKAILNIAKDLNLISLVDEYNYNSKGSSIGGGIGFGSGTTSSSHFNSGIGSISSANANFSKDSSMYISKQTNLSSITADTLDIKVGANTHLKGSLIASGYYTLDDMGNKVFIDKGNLRVVTNTLTFENLSNLEYGKSKTVSLGASVGINQKEATKFTQEDYRPQNISNAVEIAKDEKRSLLNNPNISSISHGYSTSANLNKTLATIGGGNLEISNLDKSDDLERLNRNTKNIQKDIYSTKISTYVDTSIDTRLFTKSGRDSIKNDFLIVTDALSNNMPDENSNNPIEATTGEVLNFLGDVTLGIIPSQNNNGGALAQIGAIVVADPKFKIIGSENSQNVFVNGIMTDDDIAKDQAKHMIGFDNKIYHNPTRGILADLTESSVDFLGGTSGIAKQICYEMKLGPNDRYVAHSQGSLIVNSAVKYYGLDGKNIVYVGTPLYREFDNGKTINSSLDPIHNPLIVFHPSSWKARDYDYNKELPILYDHVNSLDYKNVIDKTKER